MRNGLILMMFAAVGMICHWPLADVPAQGGSAFTLPASSVDCGRTGEVAAASDCGRSVQVQTPATSPPPVVVTQAVEEETICTIDPLTGTRHCQRFPRRSVLVVPNPNPNPFPYPTPTPPPSSMPLITAMTATSDPMWHVVASDAAQPGGGFLASRGSGCCWFPGKILGKGIVRLFRGRR